MSIALERGGGIGRPAFPRVIPRFRPHRPPPETPPPAPVMVEEWEPCSSSSIGRAAEGSDGEDSAGEVQSALKGPLDTMDLLEETLPFRRSISKFYCGKSKSFASMTDVLPSPSPSPSSAKDLRKSANSDTRKRKSLFPFSKLWERSRPNSQRSDGCSIAKRPANADRTTFAVASSKSSSGSNSSSSSSSSDDYHCQSQLHTQSGKGTRVKRISLPMRSCSLMDLEGVECGELELHVQRRG